MERTSYRIEHMDCSTEEQLVRMCLGDLPGVEHLEVDLAARSVTVYHTDTVEVISGALERLELGAQMTGEPEVVDEIPSSEVIPSSDDERAPLAAALAINGVLFVGEFVAGLLAGSMGLMADSLDMLADAFVYALSLAAVGGTIARKKLLARWSGYLQFSLAIFGIAEVARRFASGEGIPDVTTMMVVAAIAMMGNVATLAILTRAKRGEAHVEASWIFTSNDIKVNGLVIISAGLVWALDSQIPDLLAGALIFLIVANGARRILTLAR